MVFTTHTSKNDGERCCFYNYRDEKALRTGDKKNERSESVNWSYLLPDELHKPIIKNFPKRKVYVNGIDKIWAADLVEMQAFSEFNSGVRYLLTVIDRKTKLENLSQTCSRRFSKNQSENQKSFRPTKAESFTTKMCRSWV